MKGKLILAGILVALGLVAVSIFRRDGESPLVARHSRSIERRSTGAENWTTKTNTDELRRPAAVSGVPENSRSGLVEVLEGRLRFRLSEHEAQIIDMRFGELVARREELELSLAKREEIGAGTVFITIPVYREKGEELYSALSSQLTNDLGAARTQQIMTELGPLARVENNGLGNQNQSILVDDNGDHYHVIRGLGHVIGQNGTWTLPEVATISDLRKSNLLSFAYLKPLFPGAAPGK